MPGSKMNVDSGESWFNVVGKFINRISPPALEQEQEVPDIALNRAPSSRAVEANTKSRQMIEQAVKQLAEFLGGNINDVKSQNGKALISVILDIVTNQYASFLCDYYRQDGLYIEFTQEEHPRIQSMYIDPASCELAQEAKSDMQLMQEGAGVVEHVQEKLSRAAWRFSDKKHEYEAAAKARLTPNT